MNEDIRNRFLINSDDTGRFLVTSTKTGKTYFVETIDGDELTKWGDYDPATKKFQTENYGQKHKGSIKPEETMITEDNGFTNIHELGVGVSPLDHINRIDNEYYEKHMK